MPPVKIAIVCCLVITASHADDAAEAKAVLDKAIKAVGGMENLSKHQGVTWKGSGFFLAEDKKITFTDDWSAQSGTSSAGT